MWQKCELDSHETGVCLFHGRLCVFVCQNFWPVVSHQFYGRHMFTHVCFPHVTRIGNAAQKCSLRKRYKKTRRYSHQSGLQGGLLMLFEDV